MTQVPYGQYAIPPVEECVNFKIGQPAPEMLPLEKIREAAAAKFAETDPRFLQYGNIYGFPKFRDQVAAFLTKHYKTPVSANNLLATNGNTGALSLLMSLLTKSGDLVLAEEPTYFLAKRIFEDYNVEYKQIPMQEDGIDLEKLKSFLAATDRKPVFLYIVSTAHNPTGRTLSLEKRKELVKICKENQMLLLVDEVYQLLTFPSLDATSPVPPPMCSFDEEGNTVIAMGSFSKILAPALRVGFLQVGGTQEKNPLLEKIAACGQLDSSGGLNPVSFGLVEKSIELGILDKHLAETRATLEKRYNVLSAALKDAGIDFEVPQGGYFVLVKLKSDSDSSELLKIAQKKKVMFLPGNGFAQSMKNYLRLSFSMYNESDIKVGVQRLAEAIKEYEQ
eukprot:maker-scaffold_9-snap-gene-1.35-mRNA-1 protein AED:0.00 eAED:0.00 QI:56/1/1/1/1/1/2/43/391